MRLKGLLQPPTEAGKKADSPPVADWADCVNLRDPGFYGDPFYFVL